MELVSSNSSQQLQRLPPITNQVNKSIEIGGKYNLTNNAITHVVPPRNALRANSDNQLGVIDTWPAHSTNQRPANMQITLTKNNNLIVSNIYAEGKADLTPKPKFLENLEKFLQRELKALGVNNKNLVSSESRLQAYREAFEYLLEEFKTYKPILSSIKNEYEMMLASQREKIRELEPLKQMLVTLADQCDYKLMQYREDEKLEIKQLKEEKKRQMDLILELKNEKQSLQIQVDKLQSELSAEHERFRNEQDKKKLLILDLNDLRFQQEEAKMAELKREKKRMAESGQTEDASQDDPVTLKIALRVCRQNLTASMKRLTKMEADYNDVIPRRDFIALENSYNQLKETHESLDKENTKTKHELTTHKDQMRSLETKFQELQQELDYLKGSTTPRPEWDRCSTVINPDKWKEVSSNKSSIALLETLLNEVVSASNPASKSSTSTTEYYTGLGTAPTVPLYLRFDGKIKKIKLSKTDVCTLITDLWKERENTRNLEMADFLMKYLKKKYSSEQAAFEYSYSMNESFDRYSHNELIQQFSSILNERLDEEVYYNEQKEINKLFQLLKETEKTEESTDGTISKTGFLNNLKAIFKQPKNLDSLDTLIKIADEELEISDSSSLDYKLLFNEDYNDKRGQFLNVLKSFLKEERLGFARKIRENIGKSSHIAAADLKKTINIIDESLSEKDVDKIINWCFKSEKQIDFETFISKIESCGFNI